MTKNRKKSTGLTKNKTKRLSNYSLIPWDSFATDIQVLKDGYEATSTKEVIKNAVKEKVKEFSL